LFVRETDRRGVPGLWRLVLPAATLSDFTSSNRHANESSPSVIARRGLYQELGLSDTDISASDVRLHSFAWASDLLDYKFFGHVVTSLSYSAVQNRWRDAPIDRPRCLIGSISVTATRASSSVCLRVTPVGIPDLGRFTTIGRFSAEPVQNVQRLLVALSGQLVETYRGRQHTLQL
jgi:hypothetical protein